MSALSAGLLSALGGAADAGNEYAKQERQFEHEKGMLDSKQSFQSQLEALKYANQVELSEFEKEWRTEISDKELKHGDLKDAEKRGYESADNELERKHQIELERMRQSGKDDDKAKKLNDSMRKKFEANFQEIAMEGLKLTPDETINMETLRRESPHKYEIYRAFKEAMLEDMTHSEAMRVYRSYRDLLKQPSTSTAVAGPDGDDWSKRQEELRKQYPQ